MSKDKPALIVRNKTATRNYKLGESFQAGIVLEGWEVKSLRNGKVDAIFVVAGYPTGAIVELASAVDIKLVPIDGAGAKKLTDKYGFFSQSAIPSGTYENVGTTNTIMNNNTHYLLSN